MKEKGFSTLHHACVDSLEKLELASRQTLNLVSLVKRFPTVVEHQTALHLQHDRERRARANFLSRQRKLLRSVNGGDTGLI